VTRKKTQKTGRGAEKRGTRTPTGHSSEVFKMADVSSDKLQFQTESKNWSCEKKTKGGRKKKGISFVPLEKRKKKKQENITLKSTQRGRDRGGLENREGRATRSDELNPMLREKTKTEGEMRAMPFTDEINAKDCAKKEKVKQNRKEKRWGGGYEISIRGMAT